MGLWLSLSQTQWPDKIKTSTKAQRVHNYALVKKLTLTNTPASNLASTQIVLNCDSAFVQLMKSQGVFDASRTFGTLARQFDHTIADSEEFQAGRNAWAAFGLQLRSGLRADCNSAVVGYSLLYPYSDNYLDDPAFSPRHKQTFQQRFRSWLAGEPSAVAPSTSREEKVAGCVKLVEQQWNRPDYADVFRSLVAINDAQTASLDQHCPYAVAQLSSILHITAFKGGTSVLADLYITQPTPSLQEQTFAFAFGVALQIVDDLQDCETDLADDQQTIATLTKDKREVVIRLFNMLRMLLQEDNVAEQGMRAMCYTMVLKQVSRVSQQFDQDFLDICESYCPLPMAKMSRLAGMRTLLKMVKEGRL
jgi:hypothetical protein